MRVGLLIGVPAILHFVSRHPQHWKAVLFSRAATAAGFRCRCSFCPKMLTYEEATVDHEPPLALGGSARAAVLACDACNQRRGQETNTACNKRRKGKGAKKHKSRKRR